MRLLRTDDYKLVEANDLPTPFPEYAILSHTWISPKDEITYQDFKQRKADIENDIFKQKGWAKLREYCDRAAKDGWDWAWMDTCCIDKTNSADTEKAINAMFRWYQSAGICYAYLDDVDAEIVVNRPGFLVSGDLDDTAGRDNVADPTSFSHRALKAFLIQAKWFTRGWTLQELLAPPYLVFVDQAWRRIGTRESWADEIKEASRIEARHLTNFSPTNFTSCSIAMRLSWASCRETTVEEDETYSLLGLFGISLPLIYGEGRWRAFNRLQRELITVYNDDSIFAWIFGQTANRHSPESPQQGGTFLEYEERRERPDTQGHGRGILAPSIREYRGASDVEAFDIDDNGFAMTNKGIEFSAKRWRHKDGRSGRLIVLNCGPGGANGFQKEDRFALPLKPVADGRDMFEVDEIRGLTMVTSDKWEEEPCRGPTVIRASNYSTAVTSTSIFSLEYPEQIRIGKKYFVDFNTSSLSTTPLTHLDGSCSPLDLADDELIVKPNRLVFINIELHCGLPRHPKFDIVINLNEKSFPSVGIVARGQRPWQRLGDPLDNEDSCFTYEGLAHHLHYGVKDTPAYPVNAVDERDNVVISVLLLPRPRQQRPVQGAVSAAFSATRAYSVKISVQQNADYGQPTTAYASKRRRLE
ncbi:HET domain-containing protein [Apiospora kogelbergensis]|uniref:HET domain-containing protein n=1 Tax=Apiospora kogelbergensis TaxID=1337665 RepID=UPI0031318263